MKQNVPIARRTRAQTQTCKQVWEEKSPGGSSKVVPCSGNSGSFSRAKKVSLLDPVWKAKGCSKSSLDCSLLREYVTISDDDDDDDDSGGSESEGGDDQSKEVGMGEFCADEMVVDDVEFLGEVDLRSEIEQNLRKGLEEVENVITIDSVDSGDEDDHDTAVEKVIGDSTLMDSKQSSSHGGVNLGLDEMETSSSEEDSTASEDEGFSSQGVLYSVSTDDLSSCSGKDYSNSDKDYSFEGREEVSECESTGEESASDGGFRERESIHGLNKKKPTGLDMLIDSLGDEDNKMGNSLNGSEGRSCVAHRTRSHFGKKGKDMMNVGYFSRPLCLDDDDDSHENCKAYSGIKSPSRKPGYKSHYVAEDGQDVCSTEKYKNFPHRSSKRRAAANIDDIEMEKKCRNGVDFQLLSKRKCTSSPKDHSIMKILVDSIWDNGEISLEEQAASGNESLEEECNICSSTTALQRKFTFGYKELEQPTKSEYEKELDKLWDELDFSLKSCGIEPFNADMVGNEDDHLESNLDRATLCHQGNHEFILDEELGLKCKYCSLVQLEIKYIVPSFRTGPSEKSRRRDFSTDEDYIWDEFCCRDSGYNLHSGLPLANVDGTVWEFVPEDIRTEMFPHQHEGFEFIWKNMAGGIHLDELRRTPLGCGNGCIISHAPGTGKTLLTIVFLQTFVKQFPSCRPVIIAPRSMLLTWEAEFRKWKVDIPFHNLNRPELSGHENEAASGLLMQSKQSVKSVRMLKIYSWTREASILGISYTLFEKLTGENGKMNKSRHKTEHEKVRKILLELPGLLVLDEGHTPRNDQSLIWKALSKVETQRRIILSGTPFQNNFDELFNTLCLVRPKFAEKTLSGQHFHCKGRRGRKRNEVRGRWTMLTSSIGKQDNEGLQKLKIMIEPFVHVHEGTILRSLPGLRDSVVVLKPCELQKSLLEGVQGLKNPLFLGYAVSLISVHPSLASQCSFPENGESVDWQKLKRLRLKPEAGVKTKFIMELVRLSDSLHEKVLVFSQYIDPLTFIGAQLKSHFSWIDGKELLYMDGQLDIKQRQASIDIFNSPSSEVRVLLASTKACSEGINLIGASRVVLLDVVWNPSVERQAISRAYRIGQEKVVHIYHLITSGTIEGEKYCRQVEKDRLSQLVFSSADATDISRKPVASTGADDKILEEMISHPNLSDMFERIIRQPKESNLIETFNLVDI